jgi:hypothetical protein
MHHWDNSRTLQISDQWLKLEGWILESSKVRNYSTSSNRHSTLQVNLRVKKTKIDSNNRYSVAQERLLLMHPNHLSKVQISHSSMWMNEWWWWELGVRMRILDDSVWFTSLIEFYFTLEILSSHETRLCQYQVYAIDFQWSWVKVRFLPQSFTILS